MIKDDGSSSSQSSKYSVTYLNGVLERLKSTQTRKSTSDNYFSIWRHFNRFLIGLPDVPCGLSWENKTVLFLTYLVDWGVQPSTIRSYTSAIKHILVIDSHDWDDKQVMLTTIPRVVES